VSARESTLRSQEVGFMPRGSSPKRERQYRHIEASAERRGESSGRAKEIAARVNGHGEIRVGGRVISWLAAIRIPGWWPADFPAAR
jgi:hypothetical protein